jgi:hypothetical protein
VIQSLVTLLRLSRYCLPVAKLPARRVRKGSSAARDKQAPASSDQRSEELPGGDAEDAVLHEVQLDIGNWPFPELFVDAFTNNSGYSSSTWPSHSMAMPRWTDWEAGQPFSWTSMARRASSRFPFGGGDVVAFVNFPPHRPALDLDRAADVMRREVPLAF